MAITAWSANVSNSASAARRTAAQHRASTHQDADGSPRADERDVKTCRYRYRRSAVGLSAIDHGRSGPRADARDVDGPPLDDRRPAMRDCRSSRKTRCPIGYGASIVTVMTLADPLELVSFEPIDHRLVCR